MPRHYGRISTSLWRDDDFRQISKDARLLYVALITQADVNAAGVLAVVPGRWAKATGLSVDELDAAIDELVVHRYVVVDNDSQELLIRTFVKWDGGASNDLRRKAIAAAAGAIESASIAAVLVDELDRLGVSHGLSKPLRSPIEAPSDRRRVVVTKGEYVLEPQPATHNPEPEATTGERQPPGASAEPSPFCKKHPNGTDEPCGACGTARKRWERWQDEEARRLANTEAERRAAIRDCRICNDDGFIEDFAGQLVGRCEHTRRTA